MPEKISRVIDEFVENVKGVLGKRLKKIILYGSYARGDYNSSSDIDIMILTDLTDEEIEIYKDKMLDIVFDIELKNNFDITLSPLLKNIEKFNYWLQALPFYMNIQKEGVIISE